MNTKNRTYYFYNDSIKIFNFDPNIKISSVNPLYFLIYKIDGFIEEKRGNKYLNIAFTGNNDEVLKKYKDILSGIKSCIEKINDRKSGEYEKDYMKIKFNSDDKLSLNKQLKFLSVTIVIRSIFEEDGKYYP